MYIRNKLRIVGLVTVLGLASIAIATLWGLNAVMEAEEAANRRLSYSGDLLEVKASALSTIMLDPSTQDTRDIFKAAAKNISDHGQQAMTTIRRKEVRDALGGILAQWQQYLDESDKIIRLAESDPKAANDKLLPLYTQSFKPMQVKLEAFVAERKEEARASVAEAKAKSSQVLWIVSALLVLGTASTIIVILAFSVGMQASLKAILTALIPISGGNLTQRLPDRKRDELDEIARSVNGFVEQLQSIIQGTRERSDKLASAAVHLSRAADDLLQNSSQQSDATSAVAASVEEFSVSIDQVSDNATQAEQRATESGEIARRGSEDVHSSVTEIQRVEQVMSEASKQMETLGDSAKGISSIVNVIKDVADQTNLLALNAAIEAARAGEQGRGFAVVADEVRKLAERTSTSAQEITEMVASVQQGTAGASSVMQKGNELVGLSVRQIHGAGESMQQINAGSNAVVGAISEISNALREQRLAGAEIAKNVERIAHMTESSRAATANVTDAAQALERLAKELQGDVVRFTV